MTLGNFDGMHVGHEALVRRVKKVSDDEKLLGGLLTFDPHPTKVLAPEKQTKSIFDMADKIDRVKKLGLDFFVIEPFSREVSQLDPKAFLNSLTKSFAIRFLVVGYDFNFGRNRSGTLEVLKKFCESSGIVLEVLPPVKIGGEVVSSSLIRKAVANGEVEKANLLLGRPFFLKGVVEKGASRGKTIGFPTANLLTKAELIPKNGVYITFFNHQGQEFHSVTNVGENPTFKNGTIRPIQIETHILDFKEEIYGEQTTVKFLKHLRPEMKFNSVEELIKNIKKDIVAARTFWETK